MNLLYIKRKVIVIPTPGSKTGTYDLNILQNDDGGPLMASYGYGYKVIGIVMDVAYPCGQHRKPTKYTRVSQYIDWIEAKIATP